MAIAVPVSGDQAVFENREEEKNSSGDITRFSKRALSGFI
jgi:hypothetical protein